MKTPRILIVVFAILLAGLAPRPVSARDEVSFDFFYDSLAPYGEWIEVGGYGLSWRPAGVDDDWAPYADGYWTFTDAGWTWVSYEEFGGIVYHYGRWIFAEDEGWCWVPDYEWGPAWVSWRESDDYVGWAPLPPEARWRQEVGISIWVDRVCDIGPGFYNFCRVRDFGAPVLRPVIIRRSDNVTIIRRTVNITNITYRTAFGDAPLIYNSGPNYAAINSRCARPVPALKLVRSVDVDQPRSEHRRSFTSQLVGNQLVVAAPVVTPPADPSAFKSRAKRMVSVDKVSRGWGIVKNAEIRQDLKQEMQRQTKGSTPENSPARPVAAAELKVLPPKADPSASSPVTVGRERLDRGKKDKPPQVATVEPPTATEAKVPDKPPGRDPGLKPFRPVAETERSTKPERAPGEKPPALTTPAPDATPPLAREKNRTSRAQDEVPPLVVPVPASPGVPETRRAEPTPSIPEKRVRGQAESIKRDSEQAEKSRQTQRRSAEAAAQQVESQRQAEALRQRQQAEAAAASQEKQAEIQKQRAAVEAARTQAAERARQQQEQAVEMHRRQQSDQQAAEQQQRRQIEAQQRAAEQANHQRMERAAEGERQSRQKNEAAEQARRAQEGQREQLRQQAEAQRQAREAQRAAPPPNAPPQSAPPAPDNARHHKDKDKDKDR